MFFSRRRLIHMGAASAAAFVLSGQNRMVPQVRRAILTEEERADLDRIGAYLNAIKTLSAGFVQVASDGSLAQGRFYLSRPGRLRFEYDPPSPTLVVGTGGRIYVKNSRLNTVDSYSISDTPLQILLDTTINLRTNLSVLGVTRQPGALVLRARSSNNRTQENIAIVFAAPQIEIRQWTVRDAQGGTTNVALTDLRTGVALDDALFAVPTKGGTPRRP